MWASSAVRRLWNKVDGKQLMQPWYAPQIPVARSIEPRITWIGHATFLIQIGGFNILTDPVFGAITPLFPRNIAPGLSVDQLPPIDALLISHNHWDHLHGPSLLKLRPKFERWRTEILVPMGDHHWFARWGFSDVQSFEWGQSYELETAHAKINCTFLPAEHWSRHGVFDRNKSLWGSWMISYGQENIYFAGDSAYGPHFKEIANHFPAITTALMPIAPCEPHRWLELTHMNAEQAVQATLDVGAHTMIPMHWGTFNFGYDYPTSAVERVQRAWKVQGLAAERLLVAKVGESIDVDSKKAPLFSRAFQEITTNY